MGVQFVERGVRFVEGRCIKETQFVSDFRVRMAGFSTVYTTIY